MAISTDKATKLEGRFTKIARLFARNRDIQVSMTGTRCDTGANGIINLPANADYLTDDMQDQLEGMLDHEWSHQAEESEAKEAGRMGPLAMLKTLGSNRERMMFNVFEDIRIEAKYSAKYIGVAQNLAANQSTAFKTIKAKVQANPASAEPWWLFGCGIIGMAQGHDIGWMPKGTRELLAKVADLIPEARTAKTAADAKRLAIEVCNRIKEATKPPPPPPEDGEGEGGEEGEEQGEPQPGKGGKGEAKPKSDSKDKGEGGKEQQPGGQDDEAEGEGSGSSGEEDGEEDGEGSGSGGSSGDEAEGDESEGGEAEGEGAAKGEPKGESKPDSKGSADRKDKGEGKPGGDNSVGEAGRMAAEKMMASDAAATDLTGAVKDSIERAAKADAISNQRHLAYPAAKAMDSIVEVKAASNAEYQKLLDSVKPQVAGLRSKILTVLRSLKVRRFVGDKDTGVLDGAALYSLRTGNKRIFAERTAEVELDTVVGILIDQSGSMASKLVQTRAAVIALSEALFQIGVPFATWGFSNDRTVGLHISSEDRNIYNRFESNDIYLYKGFDQSFKATRTRLVRIRAGGNNVDNEFVEWSARQLAQRKESRKILIVLSDGAPMAQGDHMRHAQSLKDTVKRAMSAGIEVFGLGIQTNAVKAFYPEHATINDMATMAPVMFRMLRDYMLKRRTGRPAARR